MLTYADRLAAMRETKIRHTLEKKRQNGFVTKSVTRSTPLILLSTMGSVGARLLRN